MLEFIFKRKTICPNCYKGLKIPAGYKLRLCSACVKGNFAFLTYRLPTGREFVVVGLKKNKNA